jgi:hypothetical protein
MRTSYEEAISVRAIAMASAPLAALATCTIKLDNDE